MMRSSYVENGNLSMENHNDASANTMDANSAISSHQKNEKYYQDAISWYQKADSLNIMINAMSEKKSTMSDDLSAFYENLEAVNKQTVNEIKNGEVPIILASAVVEEEPVEEIEEVKEVEEEDEAEEVIPEEIVVAEEVVENETYTQTEEGDKESNGFMYEEGIVFYSSQDPIPVNPPLPEGLIYKVQIGAFRNPLPSEHFTGLSPMMAEKLDNGITRYSVGIFKDIEEAKRVKTQVQGLGYNDAFVIAFLNGKRVPLNTAVQMSQSGDVSVVDNSSQDGGNISQDANSNNSAAINPNTGDISVTNTVSVPKTGEEVSATDVTSIADLFFCVQVGVFSKEVQSGELFGIQPLNVELTGSGYYRYTSGQFSNIPDASASKNRIIQRGIPDAFVTAYYQGTRISLGRASGLLEEDPSIAIAKNSEIKEEIETPIQEEVIEEVPVVVAPIIEEAPEEVVQPVVSENLPNVSDLTFVIFIGSYTNSIPNNVATALLENSDVGIKRAVNAGKMIYSTKELDSYTEATIILQRFQERGVEQAKMLYVLDGNEISEQKALKILAQ